MDICPVYTGKREQNGYDIDKWYRHQMKVRIRFKPHTTNQENRKMKSAFTEYYRQIKASKPTKHKRRKRAAISYPTCPRIEFGTDSC